jgi:hypothetical protein
LASLFFGFSRFVSLGSFDATAKTTAASIVLVPLQSVDESAYHQLFPMAKKHAPAPTSGAKGKKTELPGQEQDTETKGVTTAIHIPENTWKLLRAVAFRRAQDRGGRASVSKVLAELVERHRGEFEQEVK